MMIVDLLTNKKLVDRVSIYVSSFIVFFGVLGNLISFLVFVRSGRRNPRIVTRNLLLLLTVTNSTYLILYWIHRVLPKLIIFLPPPSPSPTSSTLNPLLSASNSTTAAAAMTATTHQYQPDYSIFENILTTRNVYSCRIIIYMINVAICLNATVTVSFSIERAVAITFPFASRDLRQNYKPFFKFMVALIILIAFSLPIYNPLMFEILPNETPGSTRCDIPQKYEQYYIMLTLVFVAITLAIPFVIITISNISVLVAIYKSNRSMIDRTSSMSDSGYVPTGVSLAALGPTTPGNGTDEARNSFIKKSNNRRTVSISSNSKHPPSNSHSPCKQLIERIRKPSYETSKSSMSIRGGGSVRSRRSKTRDKNSKITGMLLGISACFVLLNFPYFVAWCNHAYSRVQSRNAAVSTTTTTTTTNVALSHAANSTIVEIISITKAVTTQQPNIRFALVKITETLNLLNYAINGFLYFSTGKLYREHLFYLLGCKYSKPSF